MVQEIRKAYTSTHKHQLMRVPLYIQEVTQPLEVNAKIIISKMQTHRTTSNMSATTQVQYAHTNTHMQHHLINEREAFNLLHTPTGATHITNN